MHWFKFALIGLLLLRFGQATAPFSAGPSDGGLANNTESVDRTVVRDPHQGLKNPHHYGDGVPMADGVTDARPAILAADADGPVVLPPGVYAITSHMTLTHNITLQPGAKLKPANGVVVKLSKGFTAGSYHVFDISAGGRFVINETSEIDVLTFGATADSTRDNGPPFQAAHDALAANGRGTLLVPGGAASYLFKTPVFLNSHFAVQGIGSPLLEMAKNARFDLFTPRVSVTTGKIASGSHTLTVDDASRIERGCMVVIYGARGPLGWLATKLAAGIDGTAKTCKLVDGSLYPSGDIRIGTEIISFTGRTGNTLTGLTRGAYGTTPAAHSDGAAVDFCLAMFGRVDDVDGTTITLDNAATLSVENATVEIGSIDCKFLGLQINGNRNLVDPIDANPFPIALRSSASCIVGDCHIYNTDHGAVFVTSGARYNIIRNNDLHDHGIPRLGLGVAIWIYNSDYNQVLGNTIYGNGQVGIELDDRSGTSVYDSQPTGNIVIGNTVDLSQSTHDTAVGIGLTGGRAARITNNFVRGCRIGLYFGNSNIQAYFPPSTVDCVAQGNIIENCVDGIEAREAVGNIIGPNRLLNCGQDFVNVEKTIQSGVIAIVYDDHTVDTESDAVSDELDTISGGYVGQEITLRPADGLRTIVVKSGTGNILAPSDRRLANVNDTIKLRYDGTNWLTVSNVEYPETPRIRYVALDGVNDFGSLAAPQNLGKTFTVSFWARTTDTSWAGLGNTGNDYIFYRDAQKVYCSVSKGITASWEHTQSGEWTHYCLVRKGTLAALYVDGVSLGLQTVGASDGTWQYIGAFADGGFTLAGDMRGLSTYGVAKTASDVEAICQGADEVKNAVGKWLMDESDGTKSVDGVGGMEITWHHIQPGFYSAEAIVSEQN